MLLWDDAGSAAFVIGLGVVIVGVYVVSNAWKEPHYNVILGGDPDALPADSEAGRRRYFALNWIQMVTTWAALALFVMAPGFLWADHSIGSATTEPAPPA